MTTTLGSTATTTRRQPVALSVLVATAVVVGWVLYRHYVYPHVLDRLVGQSVVQDHLWLLYLTQAMLLCLPYAVVLLLWARGLRRSVVSALVALATGLYLWALTQVFTSYVWDSGAPSRASVRIFEWANLLVVAVLVPLAWGLARRDGRTWVLGLLVGPPVAAVLREMQLRWAWWDHNVAGLQHGWSWMLLAVQYVAPFVLAALACWALDRRAPAEDPA
jgi:hypothetical protein